MGLGRVRSKKLFAETTIHKIFETNSSFPVKQRTTGKVQQFFSSFFAIIDKIFILGGRRSTRFS